MPVVALSSTIHVGLISLALASQAAVSVAHMAGNISEEVRYIALHVAAPAIAGRRHGEPGRHGIIIPAKAATDDPPLPAPQLAFDVELSLAPVELDVPPDYQYADLALMGAGVRDDDPLHLGLDGARGARDARYNAYDLSAVERGALPDPGNPKPRYPMAMLDRRAEVSFSVFFVVDTTGLVDRETLEVPRSVQAEFARAVLDVLFRWRFAPAEVGGRRVRQHVQQPFLFRIER